MMEDILELILSILFLPFESKYEKFEAKVDRMSNKGLRIFIKFLLFAVPFVVLLGIFFLFSYWYCRDGM